MKRRNLIVNKKQRRALLATVAIVATSGLVAGSQGASALPGSTFDATDGNTIVNAPETDWASYPACAIPAVQPCIAIGTDQPTGQGDNSFTQGSKEDDVNVVIGTGSIPNSKADLGKFGVFFETLDTADPDTDGDVMMYLAWTRNNLSGTTNFDFEVNQHMQPNMTIVPPEPDRAIVLDRVGDATQGTKQTPPTAGGPLADDVLFNYDVQGGAQNPTLSFRRWTGTTWSNPIDLSAAGFAEGAINTGGDIAATVFSPPATIVASAFGEGAINLTDAGIIANQNNPNAPCSGFGSAYVKSRSSSSFDAQMKDYIAPIPIGLNTCGTIVIDKVTDPADDPQEFPMTLTGGPSTLNDSFSLTDDDTPFTHANIKAGSGYVATETLPIPAGWALTSATCSDGSPVTNIDVAVGETVTCTFVNTKQGTITVDKVTDPAGSSQSFNFNPSYGADFQLTDAAAPNASGFLAPGPYSVSEDVPTGWTLTSATCDDDDGSDPATIVLDAGETITCTFNNQARGRIIVEKQTDPDGSTQSFEFDTNYGANFFLTDGQQNDSGELVPGPYSVDEITPLGWEETGVVCNDNDATNTPDALNLDPGETITCIFSNEQDASIRVIKEVVGPDPGQEFTFTSDFGVTPLKPSTVPPTDTFNSGALDPDTYNVTEDGIANWLLLNADPAPGVTGAGGNVVCSSSNLNNEPSGAISLQAGEQVICTFRNEWQVGAVRIHKDRKHAADGPGLHPHAGVDFQILDGNGNDIGITRTTDANGNICVDSFGFQDVIVRELTPTGYAANADVPLTIDNVAYCDGAHGGAAEQANFTNTPLTNVTVSVDSQVDGGTATVISCVDNLGNVTGVNVPAGAPDNGDGSHTVSNLLPTAAGVTTLTCTFAIDP